MRTLINPENPGIIVGSWDDHWRERISRKAKAVLRVDGYYLYTVATKIHPLADLQATFDGEDGSKVRDMMRACYVAEGALEPLLTHSVFGLVTCIAPGMALLQQLRKYRDENRETDMNESAGWEDVFHIQRLLTAFETVLNAELSLCPLYVVTPKAGYQIGILTEQGIRCFPADLPIKVSDSVADFMAATKCLAFEVFTAAGFHLNRGTEAVLRKYWDAVSQGEKPPKSGNMGDYLKAMEAKNYGDAKVRSALKDLKDLHRNPLSHPGDSLETADEAIALMNGTHTALVHMLKAIPAPSVSQVSPAQAQALPVPPSA